MAEEVYGQNGKDKFAGYHHELADEEEEDDYNQGRSK